MAPVVVVVHDAIMFKARVQSLWSELGRFFCDKIVLDARIQEVLDEGFSGARLSSALYAGALLLTRKLNPRDRPQ